MGRYALTMKRLFPLILAAAATPALAQQSVPAPKPATDPAIVALRDAALGDNYAYEITEGLTTEVGQRLAGTEAEARARTWSVAKLKAMGFSNVRVEEFPLPVWTRGAEAAHIVAPYPQALAITALGNSASTGPAGITADLVMFESVDALRRAPDAAVRGKIVFVDHHMAPTQDGSSYGPGGEPRRAGPSVASSKGAVGIIVRSAGTDHDRHPHAGVQSFAQGVTPIPAGAISINDAEQLARIFQRKKTVRLHLQLVSSQRQGVSGNVIAEVPGRDRSLAPVLVSGHLDSWDLGTGAIDDASGVAIAAAAAKRVMDAGQPERTIRIVWFGAEETGLFGGLDYRARHGKTPHHALLESDFGADRIYKVDSRLGADRRAEAEAIQVALAPLGIVAGSLERAEGSDIGPMLADGLPGVGLSQDGTRYFDLHHTANDTLDKVDLGQLRQNVAAWTATLGILAGPVHPRATNSAKRR